MHQGPQYIDSELIAGQTNSQDIKSISMSAVQASAIKTRLANDALDYFYSSAVSFADAMRGLDQGFYSWATVKLYYSVFYSFRSILAANNTCVFYVKSSPYSIHCAAGCSPKKKKGNTHGVILDLFSSTFPDHTLLSQEIELQSPCEWLNKKRNKANYTNAKFSEPDIPEHFNQIASNNVRKSLASYEADALHLFTFDKDHSMVSYPFHVLREARSVLQKENNHELTAEASGFLKFLVKDANGVVPSFAKLIEGLL